MFIKWMQRAFESSNIARVPQVMILVVTTIVMPGFITKLVGL